MKIPFNRLDKQMEEIMEAAMPRVEATLNKCDFILGGAVTTFEENFSKYISAKYAIGVSNGTDAVQLSLMALNLTGSTLILIPANTFIATILAAELAYPEATLKLIDVDEYYQTDFTKMEEVLKEERTKYDNCVFVGVSLFGHSFDLEYYRKLEEEYNLLLVEDASQAHGTEFYNGKKCGTQGIASAFSLYPGKNLGACGDAGIVTTNDEEVYNRVRLLRNWGSNKKYYYDVKGYNHRLDTLQAIFLDEKLKHLDTWNASRNTVAAAYDELITNDSILTPKKADYCNYHTYHVYCVRMAEDRRDALIEYLNVNGVQTNIHYPIPIEQTSVYNEISYSENARKFAKEMVSLPMFPHMTVEEVAYVAEVLNGFKA